MPMYGLARGTSMLIGAAIAGALLWLATQFEATGTAGYWAFMGLLAAAGLVLAVSQIAGGWTKWGAPRITGGAFLLGFLPALVVGGWVLVANQPDGAWMQATAEGWANDIAAGGVLETLTAVLPAVAFALGLLFGFTFDTTGARVVAAEPAPVNDELDTHPAADEPLHAERTAVVHHDEERIEDEYREPDRDFVSSLSGREHRGDVELREGGAPMRRTDTATDEHDRR